MMGRKDGISLLDGPYASSFDSFKQLRVEANGLFKASAKPKFHPKVKPRNSALKYSSAKVKKKKESKDYVPPTVDEKKEKQAVVFSYENLNVKDGDTVMEDVANKEGGVGPSEVKDETMLAAFAKPGKDKVVREIDVYLTPRIDRHTKLYLMQYPLRPYWQPYGVKKKCKEVRVKPKQSRLEIDLVMDTDEENYDLDAMEHLKITKQTLTSSKTPLSTSYALGMLRCNKCSKATSWQ